VAAPKKTPSTGNSKRTSGQSGDKQGTASKKAGSAKSATTTSGPARGAGKPAEPVIIEPPKPASKAKSGTKPDVIEAKAVDVTPKAPKTPPPKPKEASKTAKPDPQPQPAKAAPKTPHAEKRSGRPVMTFVALVFGGGIAAAIGFYGADFIRPKPADNSAAIAAVRADLMSEITNLNKRLTAVESRNNSADINGLRRDLDALKAKVAAEDKGLAGAMAQLDKALSRLKSAGSQAAAGAGQAIDGASADLIARYGAEIDALKAQLAKQATRVDQVSKATTEQLSAARNKVAELSKTAKAAAKKVDLTQARERLYAAVETGKTYADLLAKIAAEAAVDIPAALQTPADKGVVPLVVLQQEFPAAARRALKASLKAGAADQGLGGKLMAFLKAQIGARSLEVKKGNDPDAILSQAEAALNSGDLQAATDIVRKLPKAGITEMADWLSRADTRLAAKAALKTFNKSLGSDK